MYPHPQPEGREWVDSGTEGMDRLRKPSPHTGAQSVARQSPTTEGRTKVSHHPASEARFSGWSQKEIRKWFKARRKIINGQSCAVCGDPDDDALQLAHLVSRQELMKAGKPERRDQDYDLRNFVALCRLCHVAFDHYLGLIPEWSKYYIPGSAQRFAQYSGAFVPLLARRKVLLEEL